jgi:hypothetical protein
MQAGDVRTVADRVGQVEHPHEVGRHHEARLGSLLVNDLQRALGVEAPEHRTRHALQHRPHAVDRTGVRKGADHEVQAVLGEAVRA